jgi:hypothetical protein
MDFYPKPTLDMGGIRKDNKFDQLIESSISNRLISKPTDFNELNIVEGYLRCKKIVIKAGYKTEIEWQNSVSIDRLTECDFLKEHAWVTLASGMREKVIRNLFQRFSSIFFDWKSAEMITENEDICRESASEILPIKIRLTPL